MIRILLITFLCLAGNLNAASNFVACSFSVISNAIVNVHEGDTICISNGVAIWESTIDVSYPHPAFHLRGVDTNSTTLISTNISYCLILRGCVSNLTEISDLNLVGDSANGGGFLWLGNGPPATPITGQFCLNNLQMTNVISRAVSVGAGDWFGLIYGCTFKATSSSASFNHISFYGNEFRSWTNASPLGTTNQIVVEDCYFYTPSGVGGNGHVDCYLSPALTIRNCTLDGAANTGSHGYESQVTSKRSAEIYNNVFTNMGNNLPIWEDRGGVVLCYANNIEKRAGDGSSFSAFNPQLKLYRGAYDSYQGYYGWIGLPLTPTYTNNFTDGYVFQMATNTLEASPVARLIGSQPNYIFQSTLTDSDRHVKIGANLSESLSNVMAAINLGAGAGTKYANSTTLSWDFYALSVTPNGANWTITLTNKMDGTNQYGWPGAMQHGVLNMSKGTNNGVLLYGCWQWSNTFHGTNGVVAFQKAFSGSSSFVPNNVDNLLVENRDYFNDTPATNYTALVYPHPMRGLASSGGPSSTNRYILKLRGLRMGL